MRFGIPVGGCKIMEKYGTFNPLAEGRATYPIGSIKKGGCNVF
jgi:hypothetical protein